MVSFSEIGMKSFKCNSLLQVDRFYNVITLLTEMCATACITKHISHVYMVGYQQKPLHHNISGSDRQQP